MEIFSRQLIRCARRPICAPADEADENALAIGFTGNDWPRPLCQDRSLVLCARRLVALLGLSPLKRAT